MPIIWDFHGELNRDWTEKRLKNHTIPNMQRQRLAERFWKWTDNHHHAGEQMTAGSLEPWHWQRTCPHLHKPELRLHTQLQPQHWARGVKSLQTSLKNKHYQHTLLTPHQLSETGTPALAPPNTFAAKTLLWSQGQSLTSQYWWDCDWGYEMPHKLMAGLPSKPSTDGTTTLSLISVEELSLKISYLRTIHGYSGIKNCCIM